MGLDLKTFLKQTEEATYEATGKLVDGKLGKPPVFVFW